MVASQAAQTKARLEVNAAYEEAAHKERMQRLDEKEKQDKIWAEREKLDAEVHAKRQMHARVLAEAQEKQSAIVDEFYVNYVAKLHEIFNSATTKMLKTTEKNQYFHPRSVLQLKNMITLAEQVRGYGGAMPDIDLMITNMQESYADIKANTRDKEAVAKIQRNLEAVEVLSKSALIELGQYTRSGKQSEFEVLPSKAERKRARRQLGAVIDDENLAVPVQRKRSKRKVEAVQFAGVAGS